MELVKFLREQKIEHYKTETVELKFSMMAHLPEVPTNPISKAVTEDELLFYSAGDRPA